MVPDCNHEATPKLAILAIISAVGRLPQQSGDEAISSNRRSGKKTRICAEIRGNALKSLGMRKMNGKGSDEGEDGTHADENTAGGIHAADGNG